MLASGSSPGPLDDTDLRGTVSVWGEGRACARAQSSDNSREFYTELFLPPSSSDLKENCFQLWVHVVTLKQLILVLVTNSLWFDGSALMGVLYPSSLSLILSLGALYCMLHSCRLCSSLLRRSLP